jgi:hypothetical protein
MNTPLVASAGYELSEWFYKEDAVTVCRLILHGDGTHRIRVGCTTSEYIYWYDDSGIQYSSRTTTPDTWVHLEVKDIDWVAATFDIYVNNGLWGDNCSMETSANNADVFGSQMEDATVGHDVYVDNIEVRNNEGAYNQIGGFSGGIYSENISGLNAGELYYFAPYGISYWATLYGTESTFLTKPIAPTLFNCNATLATQNNLGWTIGTGSDNTIIQGKVGSFPTSITDGTAIYNGTGASCNHTIVAGTHWYYRAWSYATEGGLEQYSDDSMMDSAMFGVGIPAAPDCPNNITIMSVDDTVVLTWNIGLGADNTLIVRSNTGYPADYEDGDAAYYASGDNYTDYLDLESLDATTIYYRLWSSNAGGLSGCYAEISVGGYEMSDAIGMIGVGIFLIAGLGINVVAWWREKWWVAPIAMFFWLGLAYYCYTQSTDFDFYRFVTWVCASFSIVSIGEIWLLRQKAEEPEETMADRYQKRIDMNLSKTFNNKNYKPPRRPPTYGGGVGDGL